MPDPPRVEYVVTKPAPASWWRLHRHQVYGVIGLLLGIWLGHRGSIAADDSQPAPTPRPSYSTPGDPSDNPSPSTTSRPTEGNPTR